MPAKHIKIHSNIVDKSLQIIHEVNPEQHNTCQKFIGEFIDAVKHDEKFRKKLGFSDVQSKSMSSVLSGANLWAIPEMSFLEKATRAIFAPFKAVYKGLRNLIFDNNFGKKNFKSIYESIQTEKKHDQIIANYSNVVGLFHSIEKWENLHRGRFGFSKITGKEKFMMSDDELQRCLRKRTFDTLDPQKGQYSVKSLSVGNRVVSGLIGGGFYAVDAYNTTMKLSNDKSQSKREAKIKFAQQIIRVALASYFTATALGVFKKQTNKSMKTALLVSAGMALASEVLGRVLVGNPVLPNSKRNLEEIKVKSQKSKNPILRFGRILGGEAKPANNSTDSKKIRLTDSYIEQRYQNKFFGAKRQQRVNFQGMPKVYKKDELSTILRVVDTLDSNLAQYYRRNIVKNLIRRGALKQEDALRDFNQVISSLSEIEIGENKTQAEKVKDALLAPVGWAASLGKRAVRATEKLYKKEDKAAAHNSNLAKIKELGLQSDYEDELRVFKASDVYTQSSKMSEEQKVASFADSFVYVKTKGFGEEIQGIQNSIEWLKKNIKMSKSDKTDPIEAMKKLLDRKDSSEVKNHFQRLRDDMNKKSFVAYAKDFVDYDASKYTLANNILSGILSATFLVFDAYNLTMLHSNNKQKAKDNATQYATQEATKTMTSSYVINASNTIFHSFYNSSLAGAMVLAAGSSLLLSSIARLATGSPLTPKTQAQLLAQEERNKNNPMLKITSRMVGRSLKKPDASKELAMA